MRINLQNSHNNKINLRDRSEKKRPFGLSGSYLEDFSEQEKQNNNHKTRPADNLSFRGSALGAAESMAQGAKKGLEKATYGIAEKFVNSKGANNLIGKIYENETKFNAAYALVLAGILKPFCVLHMPGSEEKDKQAVATKNFLQAFIGYFFNMTIAAGLINKAVETIKTRMKLLTVDRNGNIKKVSKTEAQDIAKEILKDKNNKEAVSIKNRIHLAKQEMLYHDGFSKPVAFLKTLSKKPLGSKPSEYAIEVKANELLENVSKRLPKYEKKGDYIKRLLDKSENTKSLFLKKDTKLTLMVAYNTCWKNSTGFITAILKAKVSSWLLPTFMAFLFADRVAKNVNNGQSKAVQNNAANNSVSGGLITLTSNEQNIFSKFINNHRIGHVEQKQLAFKGSAFDKGLEKAIETTANAVETVSLSKFGQKATGILSKFKKQTARMGDLESTMITLYWVQSTLRSKKIDPDQKLGLNVHSVLVTLASSTIAFGIDALLDGFIGASKDIYKEKLEKAAQTGDFDSIKNLLNQENFKEKIKMQHIAEQIAQRIIEQPDSIKDKNVVSVADLVKNFDETQTENAVKEAGKLLKSANDVKSVLNGNEITEDLALTLKKADILEKNLKETFEGMDLSGILKKLTELLNEKTISDTAKGYEKRVSKAKSLLIFTFMVRFLVPVIMVPVSGKAKKKVVEMKQKKLEQDNKKVAI